jgi:hypothetical protein
LAVVGEDVPYAPDPPEESRTDAGKVRRKRALTAVLVTLSVGVVASEAVSIIRHEVARARERTSGTKAETPSAVAPPSVPAMAIDAEPPNVDGAVLGAQQIMPPRKSPSDPMLLDASAKGNREIRSEIARLALGASSAGDVAPEPTRATMERTPCLGFCPAYTVTIDGDGSVTYEGQEFVRVRGAQTRRVDSAKVRALFAHFARARFFGMHGSYRAPITDSPTARVTLTMGGRTKTVEDYPPCHGGEKYLEPATPPELCALEEEMDKLAQSADWITCNNDSGRPYCDR